MLVWADCKMKKPVIAIFQALLVFVFAPKSSDGQGLRPQPINIAQGKKIETTSTCGEDVSEAELFCKLATVPGKLGIFGLSCDHCEPNTFTKDHSIKYAIDGTERWWQSPPLSRGLQYQRVNITIDLGQVRFYRLYYSSAVVLSSIFTILLNTYVVLQSFIVKSIRSEAVWLLASNVLWFVVLNYKLSLLWRISYFGNNSVWKVLSANQLKYQIKSKSRYY